MKLRPLHDRIIVKRSGEEERSKGGIVIPDTAKERPHQGEVLAVGPGKLLEGGQRSKIDVNVGDHVLFGKYSGTEVKIDGEEYLVLREEDVMGVIQG